MDPPQGRLRSEIDIVLGEGTGEFDIRLCVDRNTAQSNNDLNRVNQSFLGHRLTGTQQEKSVVQFIKERQLLRMMNVPVIPLVALRVAGYFLQKVIATESVPTGITLPNSKCSLATETKTILRNSKHLSKP